MSGAADVTTAAELSKALAARVSAVAPHLAVDLDGLRFADSVTIQALVRASRVLKDRRVSWSWAPAAGRGPGRPAQGAWSREAIGDRRDNGQAGRSRPTRCQACGGRR